MQALSAPACKARQGTRYPIPDPALAKLGHLSPNTWLIKQVVCGMRKEGEKKNHKAMHASLGRAPSFVFFFSSSLLACYHFRRGSGEKYPGLISAFRLALDHLILSVIQPILMKSCHILLVQRLGHLTRTHCALHPYHRYRSDASRFRRGLHNLAKKRTRFKSMKVLIYPQRTRLTHATPQGKYPCTHARHLSRRW